MASCKQLLVGMHQHQAERTSIHRWTRHGEAGGPHVHSLAFCMLRSGVVPIQLKGPYASSKCYAALHM